MTDAEYLTVGELARRVGVTVRTLQYYDQEGLLSPSAKGPQNQRLYTDENVQDLYRILTLKYLGLSLAQIKSDADLFRESNSIQKLANKQMDTIEEEFQSLFRRMTTLRSLYEQAGLKSHNWADLASTIESCQDESQFFWRLTGIRDDMSPEKEAEDRLVREESVSKWHELIADALRLKASGEAIDSPRSQELAKQYLSLGEASGVWQSEQSFILMENIVPHASGDGTFDELRQSVIDYLESITQAYRQSAGLDE